MADDTKSPNPSLEKSYPVKYNGTRKKENEQEVKGNEKREETREAFLGRASETSFEVRERGTLAFGYRRYSSQLSQNIQSAEKELKNLGIPVVVIEHMEGNKDDATTIYSSDASSIPGVAVFIHKDATLDAMEKVLPKMAIRGILVALFILRKVFFLRTKNQKVMRMSAQKDGLGKKTQSQEIEN